MIEPTGPESRPASRATPQAQPARRRRATAVVAALVAVAVVSGAVAVGVTYGILRLQARTNPQDINLGSRVRLQEDSAIADVATHGLPAVVSVVTDERGQSYGSGFLLTTDGFIATAVAVVADSATLTVLVPGEGKRHDARVVDYDCATGVAVLKIDGVANLPTLSFADSSQLKVGQTVVALGGPYGSNLASKGIVDAVHRTLPVAGTIPRGPDAYADTIAADVRLDPSNSGGPLVNVAGQVVGMDVTPGSAGADGFALSSNSVQPVVEQIVQSGQLQVAEMGVQVTDLTSEQAALRGVAIGSLVASVDARSPAAAAGIRAGDVLTQVDDNRLDAAHPLLQLLRAHYKPAQRAVVSFNRSGSSSQVELTLSGGRPVCR